jgi:hypothetical protein
LARKKLARAGSDGAVGRHDHADVCPDDSGDQIDERIERARGAAEVDLSGEGVW